MQPVDAVNGYWRALTDKYEDVMFGFDQDPTRRTAIEKMFGDSLGMVMKDIENLEHIVTAGLWSWRKMPASLLRWAWTSRGLTSREDMCKLTGLSEAEVFGDDERADKVHTQL